jgi:nitrite reductase (cytochrome c-552)
MSQRLKYILALCLCVGLAAFFAGCEPTKPQPRQVVTIPDGEIDPTLWGRAYPEEYELWKKTEEPVSARRQQVQNRHGQRCGDDGQAFPLPLHGAAVQRVGIRRRIQRAPRPCLHGARPAGDRLVPPQGRRGLPELQEPLRTGLQQEMGVDYYRKPFKEVLEPDSGKEPGPGGGLHRLPRQPDMSLKISRGFTLIEAFRPWGWTLPS